MAVKNTLGYMNDYLFEQLERLNDTELSGDELKDEIDRAKAMSVVAQAAIKNAQVVLEVCRYKDEIGGTDSVPRMISGE